MEKKITIDGVLTKGLEIGLKNFPSLLGCVVLWVLTCWVPYINIGTTIAMACLPLEMSKGNIISPLSIFDKKYFKYMGEFFLTAAFLTMGVYFGIILFVVPGLVVCIAWSLAILFLIDKEVNPMEAITMSNKATSGYKWTIFLALFLVWIAFFIVSFILGLIPYIGVLLQVIVVILIFPIVIGMHAHIYSKLSAPDQEMIPS